MNTRLMALDYMKRAKRCFGESKSAFNNEDYSMTIRRAQECVELSLKAVLRSVAVEYPRKHDVSDALEIVKDKFPDWFSSEIPKFIKISKGLSRKRGPAMYCHESELGHASDIFSREDAVEALKAAENVFKACSKLIENGEWTDE